jgi:hypothetical protein
MKPDTPVWCAAGIVTYQSLVPHLHDKFLDRHCNYYFFFYQLLFASKKDQRRQWLQEEEEEEEST